MSESSVSESSDTQQASIVFMGRESFRMEIVGAGDAGAIPIAFGDTPTERIIERRRSPMERIVERRRSMRVPPPVSAPVFEPPAPPMGKFTVIGICLMTFACGMVVATALSEVRHSASPVIAQVERPQTSPRAIQPAVVPQVMQPAAAPTVMIVQPLPKSEPEPLAVSEPAMKATPGDPGPEKRPAPAKVAEPLRARPAPVARTRRIAPAPTHPTEANAVDTAPARPAAAKKWVDPFAE